MVCYVPFILVEKIVLIAARISLIAVCKYSSLECMLPGLQTAALCCWFEQCDDRRRAAGLSQQQQQCDEPLLNNVLP